MSIFKKLAGLVTAPIRGLGHALRTSGIPLVSNAGSAVEHVGNAFAGKGSYYRELGKAGKAAAPVAALIPGVGPVAAGVLGGGGTLLDQGKRATFMDYVKNAGLPAAEAALLGGQGYKGIPGALTKLGGFAKSAGSALTSPSLFGNPQGKLDFSKLAALAGAGMSFAGNQQIRQTNDATYNAENAMRNELFRRLLEQPSYNFPSVTAPPTGMRL